LTIDITAHRRDDYLIEDMRGYLPKSIRDNMFQIQDTRLRKSPGNKSINLERHHRILPKEGTPRPSHNTDADSSLLVISELLQAHKQLREAKEKEQRIQEVTKMDNLSRAKYLKQIYRMPIHGSPHEEKILFPAKAPTFGPKLLYQINKA